MSRAPELLEQATPLPWRDRREPDPAVYGGNPWRIQAVNNGGEIAIVRWRVRDEGEPDAALIVYAVNRLPDYELLRRFVERIKTGHMGEAEYRERWENVNAALARLREQVPA